MTKLPEDFATKMDAIKMKQDHPAVIKAKALGRDFLNSLLDLDIANAGQAAASMKRAAIDIVDKVAMVGALQMLTKEGITDKPIRVILEAGGDALADDIKANHPDLAGEAEGHAAPGIN
jgi:hypothetical protein